MLAKSGAEWLPNFIALPQYKLSWISSDPVLQKMVAASLTGDLTGLFTT